MKGLIPSILLFGAVCFSASAANVPSFAHEIGELEKAKAAAKKKGKPVTFVVT